MQYFFMSVDVSLAIPCIRNRAGSLIKETNGDKVTIKQDMLVLLLRGDAKAVSVDLWRFFVSFSVTVLLSYFGMLSNGFPLINQSTESAIAVQLNTATLLSEIFTDRGELKISVIKHIVNSDGTMTADWLSSLRLRSCSLDPVVTVALKMWKQQASLKITVSRVDCIFLLCDFDRLTGRASRSLIVTTAPHCQIIILQMYRAEYMSSQLPATTILLSAGSGPETAAVILYCCSSYF